LSALYSIKNKNKLVFYKESDDMNFEVWDLCTMNEDYGSIILQVFTSEVKEGFKIFWDKVFHAKIELFGLKYNGNQTIPQSIYNIEINTWPLIRNAFPKLNLIKNIMLQIRKQKLIK